MRGSHLPKYLVAVAAATVLWCQAAGAQTLAFPGATVVTSPHPFPTTSAMPAAAAVQYVMEHAGLSIV